MTLPIKCHRSKIHMHISVQILEYFFFNVVEEDVYYAHQDCIYLIKNTVKKKKKQKLFQFKITAFYCNISFKTSIKNI